MQTKTKKQYIETPGRLVRADGKAEATRYYRSLGDYFDGWVVRSTSDRYSYSDPIPNKTQAIRTLLEWS
jgi:hypothetical protein